MVSSAENMPLQPKPDNNMICTNNLGTWDQGGQTQCFLCTWQLDAVSQKLLQLPADNVSISSLSHDKRAMTSGIPGSQLCGSLGKSLGRSQRAHHHCSGPLPETPGQLHSPDLSGGQEGLAGEKKAPKRQGLAIYTYFRASEDWGSK